MKSVYCAVRTGPLNKAVLRFVLKGLSHNLYSSNVLLQEKRGFKKGLCVEMAAFRLIGSVFKGCMLEEFSVIGCGF